ncbi:MAG TPA: hypothetical protein VJL32_03500 [Candidatus Paceibacterota bacterium]
MEKIEWKAPEFEHRPKNISWFWLTIIIAVLILALAVWQKNFLFVFFVVIAEVLILSWGNAEPREIDFVLTEKSILIDGKKRYNLGELINFSVDEPEHKDLVSIFIHFKQRFKAPLRIHVFKDKLQSVRELLRTGVKEMEHEDSIVDSLEHLIRF